jgi:hypothetical protein
LTLIFLQASPRLKMYSTDPLPHFDGVALALRFAPEEKLNTHWIPVRLPLNLRNAAFMIDVTKLSDPRDCHVDEYGLCVYTLQCPRSCLQAVGEHLTGNIICTTLILSIRQSHVWIGTDICAMRISHALLINIRLR